MSTLILRYRDAFRAICCQHNATHQRLDVLLQAMGAEAMVTRRGRLQLPTPPWARAKEAKAAADAKARAPPRWLQVLLSRLRAPHAAAEVSPDKRSAEDQV